ncbi:hypothetical protein ONJ95_25830, partial [Salmonella enterica subsp. enterica serovar Virginia]|nr:hypothetical protein [Salmonella enterica subsp. enterica serovar Virginia]
GGAVMGYFNGYLFSWQGWNAIAASCLMLLGIGLFICRFIFAKPGISRPRYSANCA